MKFDVVDLAQIQSENQPCEKLLLFYIPAKNYATFCLCCDFYNIY